MLKIEISLSHLEIQELMEKGRTYINYSKNSPLYAHSVHNSNFLTITADREFIEEVTYNNYKKIFK